jgi:hypothetical protein
MTRPQFGRIFSSLMRSKIIVKITMRVGIPPPQVFTREDKPSSLLPALRKLDADGGGNALGKFFVSIAKILLLFFYSKRKLTF